MSYDFSVSTCRKGTNSEKYTKRVELFGSEEVNPVWVADMDIDTPDFVLDAVKDRLEMPIIGYEEIPDSAFLAQIKWMKGEHKIEFNLEDMIYSPSVVASMNAAIDAFSEVGDKVIVQTPVYSPFFHSVLEHDRELLKNPLKQDEDGIYIFDIENLKKQIDSKTKLLLLCSPHNPVGRVWKRKELEQILEVCLKNNIVVFADEIHSDLIYKPNVHIPFASLSKEARDITISAIGVGKTFNMAGFAMSTVAIPNKKLREKFLKTYKRIHFADGNILSHVAFEAAYTHGKVWLEELKIHLMKNYNILKVVCDKYSNLIKLNPIEATYLAWLDCKQMGLNNKKLRDFFAREAKLGLNAGISFGREGDGFMRLNFAVSSAKMLIIAKQLDYALKEFKND